MSEREEIFDMSEHEIRAIFKYWGKADPNYPGELKWHPVVYHSLDVAAVGVAYLERTPLLKTCCGLLSCSEQAFLSWSAFLLTLHDLGKFSEAFQSQRPDLILALQKREPDLTKIYSERHDSLGYWLWDEHLVDEAPQKTGIDDSRKTQRSLKCWLLAVTGHHGMPPKPYGHPDSFFRREDKQAATDFMQAMAGLLLTDEAKLIPINLDAKDFQQLSEILSWWFAGVAVLADWLGSNTQFFPYKTPSMDLEKYWGYAQGQAIEALSHSGVSPSAIAKGRSLKELFQNIQEASPLQQWAASVD